MEDNVFDDDPFTRYLRSGERIKVVDGGERIRMGIMHKSNSTAKWYDGLDPLDVTPQRGFTTAFFNWHQGSVSIVVSGKELKLNRGQARIANLQEEKIMQAKESLVDLVINGVYSDGTGSGSLQMTGVLGMIATDPTTNTTYAEINQSTNDKWRNQVVTAVGPAASNLLPKMRAVFNDCKQGRGGAGSKPDFAVTTQLVHEDLEALIYSNVRYAPNPRSGADAGVETLLFKQAAIEWSDFCQTGVMYVLNSKHIIFFIHTDANFGMAEGGFQKPTNQDGLVTQVFVMGNLATNNRRKLGKLTGIT